MIRSTAILCAIAALALAGCSKTAEDEAPPAVEATTAAPLATETPTPAVAAENPKDIPSAIHGRWALVDADCSSTMGDAKGLLAIDGTSLKFYESRATIGKIGQRDDRRLRAGFAFSGEGQEWTQDVLLEVSADGKTLVRRDYGPDAMPGALEYSRCPETE